MHVTNVGSYEQTVNRNAESENTINSKKNIVQHLTLELVCRYGQIKQFDVAL